MNYETKLCLKVAILLFPLFVAIIRLIAVLPAVGSFSEQPLFSKNAKSLSDVPLSVKGANIMILLGSGGHTGEMLRILSHVDMSNFSRTWVVSSGDTTSLEKGKAFEEANLLSSHYKASYASLPRARSVGESIILSIKSTLLSFYETIRTLRALPQLPSVLLLNGPGTSVPLAYILFGMKYFGLCKTSIIYIESLARVDSLSVSGLLLLPISDRFIVQWEDLYLKYHRAEYYGMLI